MASHRGKKKKKLDEGVIKFGRITQDPKRFDGRPTLDASGIDVLEVIGHFRRGQTYARVVDEYPAGAINWDDILACAAWQARFMPETLSHAFNRVSRQNVIMLDENMSYMLLPRVVRLFGRSSHVYADSLVFQNNDDERCVWNHVVKNNYQAIVTADNDFRAISQRYREDLRERHGRMADCPAPAPVVIEVERQLSRLEVGDLLEKHKAEIFQYIKENDAAYATLDAKNGLVRNSPDLPVARAVSPRANRQTGRPSGPS